MNGIAKEEVMGLLIAAGLIKEGQDDGQYSWQIQEISADGSLRTFFRIKSKNGSSLCVGVSPEKPEGIALAEAQAAISIGRHLERQGVPVPRILGANQKSGLILFEDCGDDRLHDIIVAEKRQGHGFSERLNRLYHKAIEGLVHMQCFGAQSFEKSWCFDTPEYDTELMVTRESEYFLQAFWGNLVGGEVPDGISDEFHDLATEAGRGELSLFMHRDFQSRNIMVTANSVRFIDFQAGRIGPPGYDIASLLIDPYSMLSEQQQNELLSHYLDKLARHVRFERTKFLKQYSYLALQRNLQIIGAFAFLSRQRGRRFFTPFITPALAQLCHLLSEKTLGQYPLLTGLAEEGMRWAKDHFSA